MFTCPQCNTGLWKQQTAGGVLWVCPTCNGRTSTISMLRKSVPADSVNRIWQTLLKTDHKGSRKCPSCHRPMNVVPSSDAARPDILDVCKSCQFLWFDPGEREALPVRQDIEPANEENPLPMKAREVLAEAKIDQVRRRYDYDDSLGSEETSLLQSAMGFLGLPVESNAPSLSKRPVFTWLTALIITAVSLMSFAELRTAVNNFGMIPAEAGRMFGLTLITSFFLHAGILHLFGNLYFLIVFGDNVEDVIGKLKFVFLLLAATLMGDAFHILGDPRSTLPCIGASGGISGVLAYYAFRFPHARLSIMIRTRWTYNWIKLPALALFAIWIIIQFIGAAHQVEGLTGTSFLAHLGGAIAGTVIYFVTKEPGRSRLDSI